MEATALALLRCGLGLGERLSGGGCIGVGGSSSSAMRLISLLRLHAELGQLLRR